MMMKNIDDFTQEKTCVYKGETYSVRDNGAVMRHSREVGRKRKCDDCWTFGTSVDDKGFLSFGVAKVQQIVATAFLGRPPLPQYVVFHKNYDKQDNRVSNLAWVTKFAYHILQPNVQAQLRIISGENKIEKILSDFEQYKALLPKNLLWMRFVSQEEADECLQKYIDLKFSTPQEREELDWNSPVSREKVKTLNSDFHESLTPKAVVRGNMIPSYFPCCPQEEAENPLLAYYEKLQPGNVYYMNSHYKTLILEAAFYEEKQQIIVKCESGDSENAIKPWSVGIITYENGLYVHSLYKTCFQKDSADKYSTILQGKEWTGGNVFDDFC